MRRLVPGVLVLAVAAVLSVLIGSRTLSPATVLDALTGGGDAEAVAVVLEYRLPRTVAGLLGGAALAVAGVVMQGHTRNRLADPGLLGVSAGSAVAVVLAITVFGVATPAGFLPFAFTGAAAGCVLVTVVGMAASRRRDASPATLVLAGAAVSALLGAATGVLLLLDSAALSTYRFWTVGSLAALRGYDTVAVAAPFVLAGLILAAGHARALDVVGLGDDVSRGLGRHPLRTRLTGLCTVTLLVGGAVACCGSLAFVGLVVPNAVRLVTGGTHLPLLGLSAVLGAALTLFADVTGRLLVHPAELPVGVVLSLIGGPVFIALVIRTNRRPA
ncbi:FecCD family ABC transporter permease [Actinoplanes rectilineatus]|uniref:FecCD family ABC transporter permease n=1 Tax=Actinoplanes rectilineatus TaxID=113571 RepID=UPI0005F2D29E|nr:iron ABC transporter permease [Actinoplanes rectilineatus]